MSLEIRTLQNQITKTLLNQGVRITFSIDIEDDYGQYIEEENLILLNFYLEDPIDIIETIAHEAVHYLQVKKGLLIGDKHPTYWNPTLSNPDLLEKVIKEQYPPEDWKWEIPAWSLQYAPMKVLELLNS